MLEELGLIEEEARACVFFMTVWLYLGDGPMMRDKAMILLPEDKMELVPPEIIENINKRVQASICGDGYEWIDRAAPGYRATIEEMLDRKGIIFERDEKGEKTPCLIL